MFKFPKKVEYAILAMQYIASNPEQVVSAKELSEKLDISFEFLSKTLQTLMRKGLILSQKGTKGGYMIAKSPSLVTLEEIIKALDEDGKIVQCYDSKSEEVCVRINVCTLKKPMHSIQKKIDNVFKTTTLAEFSGIKVVS